MVAVADNLPVNVTHPEGRSHQPRLSVMEGRHAVEHMGHGGGPVGDSHEGLFIGCRRVAHADDDAVGRAVPGQSEILIMLRRQGNVTDKSLCRLLIPLKLLHIRHRNGLRRLCPLVFHVKIGPLKMDAQDFRPLVSCFRHSGHICHCFFKHIRQLGHCGRQYRSNALLGNPLHPHAKPICVTVVGVKAVGPVGVNVNKTGQNPVVAVVNICLFFTIRGDFQYFSSGYFQLRRHELPRNPDFLSLNPHTASPLVFLLIIMPAAIFQFFRNLRKRSQAAL